MQIRLVYYSRSLRDMSLMDIQNILKVARENNAEQNICGMLSYESQWFLQALEGDRETVNELFLEIADDPRHDGVIIIGYEYIDQPMFSNWQMGYAANSGVINETLKEFGMETFLPAEMNIEQAKEFLARLAEQQQEAA